MIYRSVWIYSYIVYIKARPQDYCKTGYVHAAAALWRIFIVVYA